MIKIYTPDQWLSAFGGNAHLVIEDDGRIYAADDYYKILSGSPIGQVDFERGYVYGEDYASLMPTPVAILETVNDEIRVYNYEAGRLSSPILYIRDNKVYTPDQYGSGFFGGDAAGYIKKEKPSSRGRSTDSSGSSSSSDKSSAGGSRGPDFGGIGFVVFMCLFLLIGNSVESLMEKPLMLAGLVIVFATTFILRKVNVTFNGKDNILLMKLSSISYGMDPQRIALCKKNAAICAGLTAVPSLAASFMIFFPLLWDFSPIQTILLVTIIPAAVFWMAYLIYRNAMVQGKMRCWPFTEASGSSSSQKAKPAREHSSTTSSWNPTRRKASSDQKSQESSEEADTSWDTASYDEDVLAAEPAQKAPSRNGSPNSKIILIALVVIAAAAVLILGLGIGRGSETVSSNPSNTPTPTVSHVQETTQPSRQETDAPEVENNTPEQETTAPVEDGTEELTVKTSTDDNGSVTEDYYDSEGHLTEVRRYYPDGELKSWTEYQYFSDGHVESYDYNPYGDLTEWESFNADSDGSTWISGFGNVTLSERIFYFYMTDRTVLYRGESTYDSNGTERTLDYYYYNNDGTLDKIVEIRYDQNGYEISNVTRNMDD